jgi:hypothetical protein
VTLPKTEQLLDIGHVDLGNYMKIKEIISEDIGKLPERHQNATVGLHIYDDGHSWASDYSHYRLGLALASTDGKMIPHTDKESWIGKKKSAHPYTSIEAEMLKRAYEAIGVRYHDINNGDLISQEIKSTNKTSPVAKKKTNKWGV